MERDDAVDPLRYAQSVQPSLRGCDGSQNLPNDLGPPAWRMVAAFYELEAEMIPSEVAAIATLIWPDWGDLDDDDSNEVIAAAYRIYNAGYRKGEIADARSA